MANEVNIIVRIVDEFSDQLDNINKNLKNTGKSMIAVGTAMAGVGIGGVVALGAMAKSAAEAEDVTENFLKLVGKDGPKLLEQLNKTTLDTISNVDLMKAANKAASLGIDKDLLPSFAEYIQRAKDAGIVSGTVTDGLDALSKGFATGNEKMLRSVGILIDVKAAIESKARSDVLAEAAANGVKLTEEGLTQRIKDRIKAMSDAEKKTIEQEAVLNSLAMKTNELAPATKDFADILAGLQKTFADLSVELGQYLLPIFTALAEKITSLVEWFSKLSEGQKKFLVTAALVVSIFLVIAGVVTVLAGAMLLFAAGAATAGVALLPLILTIAAVIAIIALVILIIVKWKDIMEFFKKVTASVVEFLISTWESFSDFWVLLWAKSKNVLYSAWNGILEYIEKTINKIISGLNSMISTINRIPGINVPLIPKANFG